MTAHEYAESLARKSMPLSHIAQATGLPISSLTYLRPHLRQTYSTPPLKTMEEIVPRTGSKRAREIMAKSCERMNVFQADVLSQKRKRYIAAARQEIMFDVFVSCPRMSLPSIGRMMNRDHTTVLHGVRTHCARIGISYPEAVAMRVMASNGSLPAKQASQFINGDVFAAAMKKYGDAMGGKA